MLEQGRETIEWGFIRSAELEDDSTSHHLISSKISAFLEQYPQMADHLAYFDSHTIHQLIALLDHDHSEAFPPAYQSSIRAFFRLVDDSDMPMMLSALGRKDYSIGGERMEKGKKGKNFTIVGKRREHKLPPS